MNDDPDALDAAMHAAAVLGAALARFDNALDRLRRNPADLIRDETEVQP